MDMNAVSVALDRAFSSFRNLSGAVNHGVPYGEANIFLAFPSNDIKDWLISLITVLRVKAVKKDSVGLVK